VSVGFIAGYDRDRFSYRLGSGVEAVPATGIVRQKHP